MANPNAIQYPKLADAGKKEKKRLTYKQRKWIAEYIKSNGNGKAASLAAYNIGKLGGKKREETARSIGAENLAKPLIRETLERLEWSKDLNSGFILQNLMEDVKDYKWEAPAQRTKSLELLGKWKGLEGGSLWEKDESINVMVGIKQIAWGNPEEVEKEKVE